MASAHLDVREIDKSHYSLAFKTDAGKLTCDVSLKDASGSTRQSADERRQAALHKAKLLTRAFHEAING